MFGEVERDILANAQRERAAYVKSFFARRRERKHHGLASA